MYYHLFLSVLDIILLRAYAETCDEVCQLWKGINVTTANIIFVAAPTPVPEDQLISPPGLPEFESDLTLLSDFMWGWSATGPQIEGAVKADGRGPSIWDNVAHKVKGFIATGETLDVLANHYYLYKQDIIRMAALEIPYYSLSLSWSRIMPTGRGTVNLAGLRHYINEIKFMKSHGITPIVTLYHWDIPQALQNEYGGWLGSQVIEDFVEYSRVVFNALCPYVDLWITLNEPQIFCQDYADWPLEVPQSVFPVPEHLTSDQRKYICGHHALLAHAKAVQLLRNEFEPIYGKSKISFANSWDYVAPYSGDSPGDVAAAERFLDFTAGWFGNPVYIDGQYPESLHEVYDLPYFTEEEESLILGSTDFYAWDAYTGHFVRSPTWEDDDGDFFNCIYNSSHSWYPLCGEEVFAYPGGWSIGDLADTGVNAWLYNTPQLFHDGVYWSWKHFQPSEYIIPEMGFSIWRENDKTVDQARYDTLRVNYFHEYLHQVLLLVNTDEVNLTGLMAWSAMDNFEWRQGTQSRFGLQYVDYNTSERYYKKSAYYFRDFFNNYIE